MPQYKDENKLVIGHQVFVMPPEKGINLYFKVVSCLYLKIQFYTRQLEKPNRSL